MSELPLKFYCTIKITPKKNQILYFCSTEAAVKKIYLLSLQDDHKISLDDLGKRYGLDLTRVMALSQERRSLTQGHLHTDTTTKRCRAISCINVISACLYWRLTPKARPSITLVKLHPPRRPQLTWSLAHL